jgi:hypothetical protein
MRLPWKRTSESAIAQNCDADTALAKLAACERDIQAAENDLRRVSLQIALSEDPDAGHDVVARLNQLRSKRELLTNALQAAEQAEAERLAAVHAREWQARRRAVSQHCGALSRDAAEVSKALAALHEGIRRMEEVGQSIVALCPLSMRSSARPYHELFSPVIMRDLVRLERFRLGDTESKPKLLGNYIQVQDPRTGIVKSMTDVLAEQIASVKAQFDARGLASEQHQPASQQPALVTNGIVIDLRGVDLGVPKVKDEPANEEDQVQTEGVTANE